MDYETWVNSQLSNLNDVQTAIYIASCCESLLANYEFFCHFSQWGDPEKLKIPISLMYGTQQILSLETVMNVKKINVFRLPLNLIIQ